MRHPKKPTILLIVILLILLPILSSGCCEPVYMRRMYLQYSVTIWPKSGENPTDVTVMLPFPMEKGEPVEELLDNIRTGYERYRTPPGVTFSIVSTQYGKMLKVKIPELRGGLGFGISEREGLQFISLFNNQRPQDRYPLSGLKKTGKKRVKIDQFTSATLDVYKTHVYISYQDGTGIVLRNMYGAEYLEPGYPEFGGSTGGVFFVGTSEYPFYEKPRAPYEIQLEKKGWISLPAVSTR